MMMRWSGSRIIFLNIILINFLCFGVSADEKELTLFFINAHNLFDTIHDHGKEDYSYLPRNSKFKQKCSSLSRPYQKACFSKNWTEKKLDKKLTDLCSLIESADPDMVGLVEVENKNVLGMLAKKCGFPQFFITEGQHDQRGIDQGFIIKKMKNLELITSSDIPIEGFRNLLKVDFIFKKQKISLFITHWPSQRSGMARRLEVARKIKDKIKGNDPAIILGDFNLVEKEEFPIHEIWNFQNLISGASYFYPKEMSWHRFDRIYVNSRFEGLKFKLKAEIYRPIFIQQVYEYNKKGEPFYGSRVVGVPNLKFSDHFPLLLKIKE